VVAILNEKIERSRKRVMHKCPDCGYENSIDKLKIHRGIARGIDKCPHTEDTHLNAKAQKKRVKKENEKQKT